jgi:hypothetical protein
MIAFTSLVVLLGIALTASAQGFGEATEQGNGVCQFVDEDGDGFNDLAPDADGDGIPNGLDPDYERPGDGTGEQHANQMGALNRLGQLGDGEALLAGFGLMVGALNAGPRAGHAYGPGDGTGAGVGPADGTGFGPGDGTGDCDGTGSPGEDVQQRRQGRR